MTNQEFRLKMRDLLPGCSEPAMESWTKYARHLDTEDMIFEADFYDEIYVNLSLIKQHQGEQIARELFDYGEKFTFNSFELRGEADRRLVPGGDQRTCRGIRLRRDRGGVSGVQSCAQGIPGPRTWFPGNENEINNRGRTILRPLCRMDGAPHLRVR